MFHTTPQERLALAVVALLLAAGAVVRALHHPPPAAEWQNSAAAADTPQSDDSGALARVRAEVSRDSAAEVVRDRPLGAGETIDLNRASVDELQRLPHVGPSLAERIVEWRRAHGDFHSLADLDSVPGVGPALLGSLASHVDLPAAPASRERGPMDLNAASAADLESLPGVGPALAGRIVDWRATHGPFRSVAALDSVPGIGPALLARLTPLLRVDR
ncbi:MAG TPA: helix-hairpin-helix domain-containing protein [Longimicrobiaceae bacterium]|nr:helix-hairpin-helix domain-containing protein [Longimicrobiaceae bacterium]